MPMHEMNTLKEQTITLKTTGSKKHLQANTLWVSHALARKVNVTEDSQLQDVVSVVVVGAGESQPAMLMTKETAENLYEELMVILEKEGSNE